MSLAGFLSLYLNLNILLVIAFGGLALLSIAQKKWNFVLRSSHELKLHYNLMGAVFFFTLLQPFLPSHEVFEPAAKVWSAPSMKSFSEKGLQPSPSGYLNFSTPLGSSTWAADQVILGWAVLGIFLGLIGGYLLIRDLRILLRIQKNSFLVRKIKNVHIYVNENIQVPFSYWLPNQANIVLPTSLIEKKSELQMAIVHELQHHRHGDTRWVYVFWLVRLICVINPAIYFWNRWISEIQEFSCDETLVDRNKVESQAYARCLVEVAQSVVQPKSIPVGATGLVFQVGRQLLQRRIEKMFLKPSKQGQGKIGFAVSVLIVFLMGGAAVASKGFVQDRRVSLEQAKDMAARAKSVNGFPIVVNDLVLQQLNRYIGTPEGREFMRNSLQRMENSKDIILQQIQKYGVPEEILVIPIAESGYRNLTQIESATRGKAAGLWQFIPSTARNFGLRVDDTVDERVDITLSTDAAIRYLEANRLRFKDWSLAVLAYNMGEKAVQKGIDATGSKDAWTLIRNGHEGDKNYLAKVMAAVLILKNPDSVQ